MKSPDDWQARSDALWGEFDDFAADGRETDFVAAVDALAAELGADDPVALHERGGARDSTGDEAGAIDFYRRSLAGGLSGIRRRECTIQLASSLRNVDAAVEAVALLQAEREARSDELDDAVAGFLALALADTGRERAALSVALGALAEHLTRYQRSLRNYAGALVDPPRLPPE